MRYAGESLWKLSYADLAQRCQEVGHDKASKVDPLLREEVRLLHNAWADAFSINTHEEGGQQRQNQAIFALRKRTIELLIKTGEWAQA
ncbi:MAG TPA: hypothetical protein VKB38_12155 [Terracidiphilus sp.]|nr:hypothetical protein [Terracidiphilus sp.]